ncbi:Outer dense fiber protein 3 [Chionoecetes opilio]|uniref:Outer dense fiber protein 3 n=1 Tax=Chionoecetes opilio TaxID=41210 RepID=A0A8J4XP40_CHIOP|nr:Outer dense fiber protein 3 [Chionoecetes opilio]
MPQLGGVPSEEGREGRSVGGGTGPSNNVGSRAPAFTMARRHELKLDKAGPGPGQYNVTGLSNKAGKDEPVAASMHIRPKDPKAYVTPAPCDYSPDKADAKVVEASPAFSFGIKVENGRPFDAPAPNSYNIPSLLGATKEGSKHSAPSFTMSARAREDEDKMKVPGPGSYNDATVDKYKTIKSPCFSMGQRTTIPSDHTMKPGPGAHCPEKYYDGGPAFSMAARLDDGGDKMKFPGPAAYDMGDLDAYLEKLPSYTMAPRTVLPGDNSPKPAPNAYSPEKYTMAARIEETDKMKVPGPGTYEAGNLDHCRESQPSYTMAPRTTLPCDSTQKPAPNAYSPEKYTMAARIEETDKMKVPGPGTYEAGDLDHCRESQPSYTMAPRTTLPCDSTQKPAPNAYSPENSESSEIKNTPHFSFGIKHSAFLGKLRNQ